MADISNIRMNPEQMEGMASEFNSRCEEFNQVVSTMKTMVNTLCEEWSGQSSQAFYDQFVSLEPSFAATSELITTIAQQLRETSSIMQSTDQEIASKFGMM
ncbi:MAG: WXG100 family type VII secretion target [Eubacteriales bacterium]